MFIGGLVRKILETKRELEGPGVVQETRHVPPVSDAARRKERELAQKEVCILFKISKGSIFQKN